MQNLAFFKKINPKENKKICKIFQKIYIKI